MQTLKKIFLPTDCSKQAHNAYLYAEALAQDLDAQLKVVHICHPSTDSINRVTIPTMEELMTTKEQQLAQFVHSEKSNTMEGVVAEEMLDREVLVGFASEVLVKASEEKDTDLIVMSTSGAGGVLERAFGSVSSSVSQNAHCPVWLVPPQTQYHGVKNILYASDYQSANQEMMEKINGLAEKFTANIHLVHINENKKEGGAELEALILEKLFVSKNKQRQLEWSTLQSERVWEGLFAYAQEKAIDLIVLVTRHRSFWERLRHKSITKEMVLHAQVPLLVMHLED